MSSSLRAISLRHEPSFRNRRVTVESRFRDLQRRANAIDIHRLIGEQFVGEHDLGVIGRQRGPTTRATAHKSSGVTSFRPILNEPTSTSLTTRVLIAFPNRAFVSLTHNRSSGSLVNLSKLVLIGQRMC